MTDERSIERVLDQWFASGPSELPDRVIDAVAADIERVGQRPAWRLRWRPVMNRSVKVAAGLAAAIAIAVVAWNLRPGPSVGPSPSPSPSGAAPTPFACDGGIPGCLGPLAGGTHATTNFQPAFSIDIPDSAFAWVNSLDRTRAYTLRPPGGAFSFGIDSQVAIPEQDETCAKQRKAGIGSAVADWVSFLTTHPGLITSSPVAVSIDGHDGVMIEFSRAASWTMTCENSLGPAIVTMTDTGTPPTRWFFTDDQSVSWWIIDVAGETVIIRLDSRDSAARERNQQVVAPVIASIRFGSATPSPQ